jgi:hypothetical protein
MDIHYIDMDNIAGTLYECYLGAVIPRVGENITFPNNDKEYTVVNIHHILGLKKILIYVDSDPQKSPIYNKI